MTWQNVQAYRDRRYTWREIGRLMGLGPFAAWMGFGPLGWRARSGGESK